MSLNKLLFEYLVACLRYMNLDFMSLAIIEEAPTLITRQIYNYMECTVSHYSSKIVVKENSFQQSIHVMKTDG